MLARRLPLNFKRAAKELLGRQPGGRYLTVLPSDVYLTSYPKSGNTWVRFLVSNMLYLDGSTDFKNLNQRVPDIYTMTNQKLLSLASPRVLKSHEYFDPRYRKVLYIVRDFRSVAVSYFHHQQIMGRVGEGTSLDDFVVQLLNGEVGGKYGTWKENILSWIRLRNNFNGEFLLIRYEDLKSDSFNTVSQISSFLGLELSADNINTALGNSTVDRMKMLEYNGIDPGMLNGKVKDNQKCGFVRSGKTTDWKEALSKSALARINEDCGSLLEELGYVKGSGLQKSRLDV